MKRLENSTFRRPREWDRSIKVEPPTGEKARKWGHARFGEKGDLSSEFLALNRNKESIVIDLKHPEAKEVLDALLKDGDVVMENFKTGVMERLGLGYEQVRAINPRIVYCSISAFGRTGPLAKRPGFDLLMQAYTGPLSITGEADRPAVRMGLPRSTS